MSAPESDSPPAGLRFPTEPYRPARCTNHFGLVVLLAITLASGIAVGLLAEILSRWIYVVVFFPLGMGLLVGVCGLVGVHTGKIAEPVLAGTIGFLGGSLALLTMHYGAYQRFLDQHDMVHAGFRESWEKQGLGLSDYLEARAREGVKIPGKRGRGEIKLGSTESYFYWGAEVLLAGGLSCWLLWQAGAKPFCSHCQSWKKTRLLGQTSAPALLVKDALATGELTRLAAIGYDEADGELQIQLIVCPRCGPEAPVDVRLRELGMDKKGNDAYTELLHVTYPGEALPVFEQLAGWADDLPEAEAPAV